MKRKIVWIEDKKDIPQLTTILQNENHVRVYAPHGLKNEILPVTQEFFVPAKFMNPSEALQAHPDIII